MTVMQKWSEAKTRIEAGIIHVANCTKEAREIIKDRCGQEVHTFSLFNEGRDYGSASRNGVIHVNWGVYGYVFDTKGNLNKEPVTNSTWPGSLKGALELAEKLEAITTGSIIAIWERQEMERKGR